MTAFPSLDMPLLPGLYLVPTPIGNLADITWRSLHVLSSVAYIAAEDTRVTQTLLKHYGIKTPMLACHEHNIAHMQPRLIEILQRQQSIALVSDAGTPLISDPGYPLVHACLAEGVTVFPLPGASSLLTALTGSGLPLHAFTFGGFIPARLQARRKFLGAFQTIPHTLVFFETTHRLMATLQTCVEVFGERQAVIARELTKYFETFYRGSLQAFLNDPTLASLKGELVLMIHGAASVAGPTEEELEHLLRQALSQTSLSDAVRRVAQDTGSSRHLLYRQALHLCKEYEGKTTS